MIRRRWLWIVVFMSVTVAALGMECWASWDGSDSTVPWTELIVRYVPGELLVAVIGAMFVWIPAHFWRRYRRKGRPGS